MDNNKINKKNELNDRNPYSSGVGTNPYRSSGSTSPYSSGTGRSPYSSNGSAGSYRNTTRSPYNSSAASTNTYSSPYNGTASTNTYSNSYSGTAGTSTNAYNSPYNGTASTYGNSAYNSSTASANTYSNSYSGTTSASVNSSDSTSTGAYNSNTYSSVYNSSTTGTSTYNNPYGTMSASVNSNDSTGANNNSTYSNSTYNGSAASTNTYSSPYNGTASTYGNSAYNSSTASANTYSNSYSGTTSASVNSSDSTSTGAYNSNTYSSAYNGSTASTNTYSSPYNGTTGTSTYNNAYGSTPANTNTYNNLYAHSNTGGSQDNNTVGYSGSGSYVNTQDNSSAQYSQREFEESLKNSSKYTVVEQYNTNLNGGYNNTSSTSTTYSPYNSSAPNPNYNMQNQYNPYNMGGATQNRDIFANMDSVKPDRKGEKKRIALAMLAIAIIVISGFGIGKFASFLVNDVFRESSFSIESRLEEKYNIIVNTGSSADITEDSMDIEMLNDEENINKALACLEEILDRLPEGFLDEVMKGYGSDRYLEINITGKMLRLTDNREVVGLTTYETYKDVIRLDGNATSWNEYKATVAHELFHVIDFEMDQFDEGIKDIRNWKATNPAGYGYSYTNGQLEQYTIYGDEIEEVYFVSEYSKEDVYEDRAEVFSYLISVDENDELPLAYESEHVQEKVVLLIEEMKDHFESADDADAYWNSWGIE